VLQVFGRSSKFKKWLWKWGVFGYIGYGASIFKSIFDFQIFIPNLYTWRKEKKNRKKLCSRFLDVLVNLKNGYGSGESLVILVMVPI